MIVNHEYIRGKTRQAEDREIRTTVYNILKNTEAIGLQTMDYQLLIQRVGEHLEELHLNYTHERIIELIDEMMNDDKLYRVTNEDGLRVGLTR